MIATTVMSGRRDYTPSSGKSQDQRADCPWIER